MEYTLVRSRRRTLAVQVTREAAVVVRAPLAMPLGHIEAFLDSRRGWIEHHVAQSRDRLVERQSFRFGDGERMFLHGREVALKTADLPVPVEARDSELLIAADVPDREQAVLAFLARETARIVCERTAYFTEKTGLTPQGVTVTYARTRWGSCSGANRLSFSRRLACLPPELVDYIVVHELCHLQEHNHSARFWALVEQFLPDCAERRKALAVFGKRLPF